MNTGKVIGNLFWVVLVLFWVVSESSAAPIPQPKAKQKPFDIVRFRSPEDGMVASASGIIQNISAKQIDIRVNNRKARKIPIKFVLSFQVNSEKSFSDGQQLIAKGQFTKAIGKFSSIERSPKIPAWVRRLATIRKIQCLNVTEKESIAASNFFRLTAANRKWIAWEAIPLCWENDPLVNSRVTNSVRTWLKDDTNPFKALVSASYGLGITSLRQDSIRQLKKLVKSKKNLGKLSAASDLAAIQLMRTDRNFNSEKIEQLEKLIDGLPFEAKAGPLLFLGMQKKRLGDSKDACTAFLQVASQYPNCLYLSLLGLNDAFYTLKNQNDPQALTVAKWLKRRFPESLQARSLGRIN